MAYGISYFTKDKRKLTREEVENCVIAIRAIIEQHPKAVQIEFKDKKSNNKYNINFNGLGKDAHETFVFYSKFKENPAEEIVEALEEGNKPTERDVISARGILECCQIRTAKKKYDKIVKLALIKCQEVTNDAFDIRCDDNLVYTQTKIFDASNNELTAKEIKNKTPYVFNTLEEVRKQHKYDWK